MTADGLNGWLVGRRIDGEDPADAVSGLLATFGPGTRLAGYQLEEQIGAGGMAVVFRAVDDRLGRRVALKILAPALASDRAFRQRFSRESRAAAAVDDPYIIPVYDAGEADGILFIAMRLVPGKDVRNLIRGEGPLTPDRVTAIISPVASALDAAHAAGLVHRDVKPANILIDARPDRPDHVYLSDFGLSKAAASSAALTGTGQFLGTPDYTAPEQIQGRQVDGRADQYALACTAFELLTGEPPFRRDHGMAVIWAHLSEPPPSAASARPGLPAAVDEVFARALAKTPAARFARCSEFAEALRAALRLVPYHRESGGIRPDAGPAARTADGTVTDDRPHSRPDVKAAEGTAPPGDPAATVTVVPADAGSGDRTPAERPESGSSPGRPGQPRRARRRGPSVNDVAFSPGGSLLAAACSDGNVRLWDVRTGALADLLGALAAQVRSVSFSPDGRMIATSSPDQVRLRDLATGALLRAVTPEPAWDVAFSPDGTLLATAGGGQRPTAGIVAAAAAERTAFLWDVATGRLVTCVTGQRGHASAVAFSPDGRLLATASTRDIVRLWDIASGRQVRGLPRQSDPADSIAFSPDGRLLATAGAGGAARLWDADAGRLIRTMTPEPAAAAAFSPDGLWLATAGGGNRPGAGVFAATAADNAAWLWDTTSGNLVRRLAGHDDPVSAVAFSPDGGMLATAGRDRTARLWDLRSGTSQLLKDNRLSSR